MTTFDVLVMLSGLCGVFMIVGAMVLLYRGIISLNRVSKQSALDVELKNMIKVTTHFPSLGLFIIGLVFIVSALMIAKSDSTPLRIKGNLKAADLSSITIRVSPAQTWSIPASTSGTIEGTIIPVMYPLRIEVTAPGYDPSTQTMIVPAQNVKFGTISLGDIEFKNQVTKGVKAGGIQPSSDALPGLSQAGAFR